MTYELTLLTNSDLNDMANGESKTVLLGNPTTSGYFFGHDGTKGVSHGSGFDTIIDMENSAMEIANNNAFRWTLTKQGTNSYNLYVNGYTINNTNLTTFAFTINDKTTNIYSYSDSSTSNLSNGVNSNTLLKIFGQKKWINYWLNSNKKFNSIKYGTSLNNAYYAWVFYEVKDIPDVYTVDFSLENTVLMEPTSYPLQFIEGNTNNLSLKFKSMPLSDIKSFTINNEEITPNESNHEYTYDLTDIKESKNISIKFNPTVKLKTNNIWLSKIQIFKKKDNEWGEITDNEFTTTIEGYELENKTDKDN